MSVCVYVSFLFKYQVDLLNYPFKIDFPASPWHFTVIDIKTKEIKSVQQNISFGLIRKKKSSLSDACVRVERELYWNLKNSH